MAGLKNIKKINAAIRDLPGIAENKVMASLTSYKIGGVADFYFEAKSDQA